MRMEDFEGGLAQRPRGVFGEEMRILELICGLAESALSECSLRGKERESGSMVVQTDRHACSAQRRCTAPSNAHVSRAYLG